MMAFVQMPLYNFYTKGRFVQTELMAQVLAEGPSGCVKYLFITSYSFLALAVAKILTLDNMQTKMAEWLLFALSLCFEILLFVIGVQMNTPNSPLFGAGMLGTASKSLVSNKLVVIVHCQVTFFKMHSYMLTNMELRNAHINAKNRFSAAEFKKYDSNNKSRGLYPYNITFKNYLRYLIIPSVVYEQDFPSTKKFNFCYFLGHFIFGVANAFL